MELALEKQVFPPKRLYSSSSRLALEIPLTEAMQHGLPGPCGPNSRITAGLAGEAESPGRRAGIHVVELDRSGCDHGTGRERGSRAGAAEVERRIASPDHRELTRRQAPCGAGVRPPIWQCKQGGIRIVRSNHATGQSRHRYCGPRPLMRRGFLPRSLVSALRPPSSLPLGRSRLMPWGPPRRVW
jgi:hypothetical protein